MADPTAVSELRRSEAIRRVADGTHHFLDPSVGRKGAAVREEKRRSDPEFAALLREASRKSGLRGGPVGGRISAAQRYRCGACDLTTSPASLGNHQRLTGHRGRERVS